MSVNSVMPSVMPVQMTVPAYTPDGQLYPQTNSGKIIGGTIGAIAGLSSSGNSGFAQTAINTATMTAIGVGVGAAVDYLRNKQSEKTANQIDFSA